MPGAVKELIILFSLLSHHMAKTHHKPNLHPRNRHREGYDFEVLGQTCPELRPFIGRNPYDKLAIDFADKAAVKMLNRALLMHEYGVQYWDFPEGYLCPAIPGRADYIHHIADLLAAGNTGKVPKGHQVSVLDIGVGANCVYPIIGQREYGWQFVGAEVDAVALDSARMIVERNPRLKGQVELRLQPNRKAIFEGVIKEGETFDVSICNPPFHESLEEANKRNQRKWKNLGVKKDLQGQRNFGGQQTELWYPGGEIAFVQQLIDQSVAFATSVGWFTTLISRKTNLPVVYQGLKALNVAQVETFEMAQGQKVSRVVAWSFLTDKQRVAFQRMRWG